MSNMTKKGIGKMSKLWCNNTKGYYVKVKMNELQVYPTSRRSPPNSFDPKNQHKKNTSPLLSPSAN